MGGYEGGEKKVYTLYFEKSRKILKVTKARVGMSNLVYEEEAKRHNDCYFICLKRKPLVLKAKELQRQWIEELEQEIKEVKAIEI